MIWKWQMEAIQKDKWWERNKSRMWEMEEYPHCTCSSVEIYEELHFTKYLYKYPSLFSIL